MKDMGAMMKQAQAMQANMAAAKARIEGMTLEGRAGGDLVRISILGTGAMAKVTIDPSLLTSDGADDLADLIMAAHADAKRQLDATSESIMREAMGPLAGLKLPGM